MMFDRDIKAELILAMRRFIDRQIDAPTFVRDYQGSWRQWRDSDQRTLFNNAETVDALNRAFTAADCYKAPEVTFRTKFDIDESQLRSEITEIIAEIGGF
jgi:hypothetical protein